MSVGRAVGRLLAEVDEARARLEKSSAPRPVGVEAWAWQLEIEAAKADYLATLIALGVAVRAAHQPAPPAPWYESRANLLALLRWMDRSALVDVEIIFTLLEQPADWQAEWDQYNAEQMARAARLEPAEARE